MSTHTYKRLLIAFVLVSVLPLGASAAGKTAAKDTPPSYWYNRISEDIRVSKDGAVDVVELFTMIYNGTYHSMWEVLPVSTSTVVTGVVVTDSSTGKPLLRADKRLEASDPASWGRYTVFVDEIGRTNVEWYYDTRDHVHTWGLSYTTRGAINFFQSRDELKWTVFGNYGVAVNTVEATVHLPGPITDPDASIYTSGGHDYYIDRPDQQTYRFRVSDIAPNEEASLSVGWQKGLVSPRVDYSKAALLWLKVPVVQGALAVLAALLVLCGGTLLIYRYKRPWFAAGRARMKGLWHAGKEAVMWAMARLRSPVR